MAKLTRDQLNKWNAGAAQGFKIDVQTYLLWGEKVLEVRGPERADKTFFIVSLRYQDETEDGTSRLWAKRTGRQILRANLKRYIPDPRVDGVCSVDYVHEMNVGEPQNKKMFSYMQKMSAEIDLAALFAIGEEKRPIKTAAPDPVSLLETFEETAPETVEDSAEVEQAEEVTAENETPATLDNNSPVSVGMQFENARGELFTITALAEMSIEINGGQSSIYDFGTGRTVGSVLSAIGRGAHLLTAGTPAEEVQTKPETLTETGAAVGDAIIKGLEALERIDSETPEDFTARVEAKTAEIFPEEKEAAKAAEVHAGLNAIIDECTTAEHAHGAETDTAEEITAEGERTATAGETVPETTPEEQTAEAVPDMFAELARAYVTGKAAKTPHRAKEAPQAKEITPDAETPTETEETAPQGPEIVAPGYAGNDNDTFTPEELATLTNGGMVYKSPDKWSRNSYITAPHSDGVRIVYSISANEDGTPLPGYNASYCGAIVSGSYFGNFAPIAEKLSADVNRKLLEMIPDEHTAAITAANVEKWERERIDSAKEYDYTTEARRCFFEGKRPALFLYHDKPTDKSLIIQYLKDPEAVIESLALAYMCNKPAEIYRNHIEYWRTLAKWEAIKADPTNEAHKLLAIRKSITDQKTVRIELTNGQEVKAEARAVKHITYSGEISKWDIAAGDRDTIKGYIKADDIRAIYHGGKTLYKAA